MEISNRLKQVIFKKLYEDLSNSEIIPYKTSIWFINRENKYWFFEYQKDGKLWWRYDFFQSFFDLFSLEYEQYQLILSEWVEEVLNYKVHTTRSTLRATKRLVEEVLNCKVDTTQAGAWPRLAWVEEVLNCKVDTPTPTRNLRFIEVEKVLKYKVEKPTFEADEFANLVEEVLGLTDNH